MNEIAIIEVDALLKLVGGARLTQNEIAKLDKAGHDPADIEGYYQACQTTLVWRTGYNPNAKEQLDELAELAALDGVNLPAPNVEVPPVQVPIFAIGL